MLLYKEAVVHRIKLIFLYNLWAWSFVFMFQGPSSIVDFVDWLGPDRGTMVFWLKRLFVFFFPSL